jgi:hypothetical protein
MPLRGGPPVSSAWRSRQVALERFSLRMMLMHQVVQLRDVVRGSSYELGGRQRALRVSYDMFHPKGAVHIHEGHVEWAEGADARRARFTEVPLGACQPGERVLLRLAPSTRENEWWLCDVLAVDGVAGSH